MCYPAGMDTTTLVRPLPVRHKNEPCCGSVEAPSLTQTQTDHLAARLKALGDPTRLRLLDVLAQQPAPLCVCDLTPHFDLSQPTISHHLKVLHEAGLLERDKRGVWVYYRARTQALASLGTLIGSPQP